MNYFLILLLFALNTKVEASDSTTVVNQRSFELFQWGISLSYGFENELLPEGRYEPILFISHLEFHAHRKQRNPDSPHFLLLFAEPQVNPVIVGGGIKEWELGCNIGLKYLFQINERNALYFHVGSGPHFISMNSPEHQADGYAFSDNFGIGYQRLFKRDVQMTFGYRFRHVSNLDLQLPNLGFDNHFFSIGFKKDFQHRLQQRILHKEQNISEE